MSADEPFAGAELASAFEAKGIRGLAEAKAVRASRESADRPMTVVLDDRSELVGDELLVAVGRRARTERTSAW